jgi:hypothetical protein
MAVGLFGCLGALVGLGVLIVVVIAVLRSAQSTSDIDRVVVTGDTSGLSEWNPGLFAWLSKDIVGHSYYYRPMGGARTSKLAATIVACQGPATLLAMSAEVSSRGAGSIEIVGRGVRVSLLRHGNAWHVALERQPFGVVGSGDGRLVDVYGNLAGWYRSGAGGAQVELGGTALALIEGDATLSESRQAICRPLLRLAAPIADPISATWLLALVGLELTTSLMIRGGGGFGGVP